MLAMNSVRTPDSKLVAEIEPWLRRATPGTMDHPEETRRCELIKARLFGAVFAAPRLGRYRLMERVGQGAMGIVYAAYDEQLDRKVAIKSFARREIDPHGAQRFALEARAMARLSHPNVVQIYEVVDDGEDLYLAMEFVDGHTLESWRTAHPRTASEVVQAFVEAGRGLAAAHTVGVVHRDFKPENVMVGADGRVRVTDFGLARACAHVETFAAANGVAVATANGLGDNLTITGSVLGTPAYMSPEQHRGEPVDHRSDQFSFCVALLEALVDEPPFSGRTMAELAVAKSEGRLAHPQMLDRIHPRWSRALRRGLSPLVDERYSSMGSLLAELELVDANRRRRRRVILGSLVGIGLTAGTIHIVAAPGHCTRAGEGLGDVWNPGVEQRVLARIESTRAPYAVDAGRGVVQALNRYVATWEGSAEASCERTHVDATQSMADLDRHAGCMATLGRELAGLIDDLEVADPRLVERAIAEIEQLVHPRRCDLLVQKPGRRLELNSADDGARLLVESLLVQARSAQRFGRFGRGRELAERSVRQAQSTGDAALVAEARFVLAGITIEAGDIEAGTEGYLETADTAEGVGRDDVLADAWFALIDIAKDRLRDVDRAGQWIRRAAAVTERLGDDQPRVARLHRARASVHVMRGELDAARAELETALALVRRAMPASLALPQTLVELGGVVSVQGDKRQALEIYSDARLAYVRELGAWHPRVAAVSFNEALIHADVGDRDMATGGFQRALDIYQRAYGADSLDVGSVHYAWATADLAIGALESAANHAARAEEIYRGRLPDDHLDLADVAAARGSVALQLGRVDEAIESFSRALIIADQHADSYPEYREVYRTGIGEAKLADGLLHDALAVFDEVLGQLDTLGQRDGLFSLSAWRGRGQALRQLNRRADAMAAFERADAILLENPGQLLEQAHVDWGLAQILVDDSTTAAGAFERARRAKQGFLQLGSHWRATVELIDRWLEYNTRSALSSAATQTVNEKRSKRHVHRKNQASDRSHGRPAAGDLQRNTRDG